MQDAGGVGTDLDARSDLSQYLRLFIHMHIEAFSQQGQSRRKSADPASDHCD
jgi:hypothetical protein